MGLTSNLLYLLLLYAVLDKEGKLSVSTGLLIALGIIILSICCPNITNPCARLAAQQSLLNNFAFSNALT